MSEEKEVVVTPKEVFQQSQTPEVLISRAIDKGVSVETMERLLLMRRELKAEHAKESYDKAMSKFQAHCPTIEKTKTVKNKDGTVRYKFAPIEKIVEQVKPEIQKRGFSYTIDAKVDDGWVTAICKITHTLGHSEISSFKVPIDPKSFMNEAQKFASALTFAKRYAFCNAFGILTGDEDDDSQVTGKQSIDQMIETAIKIVDKTRDIKVLEEYKEKIMKSKKYNDTQKSQLVDKIDSKIDSLKK